MKKIILTIALIGISFGINSQNFDSLTAAGSNKKIEWTTSTWGSGFGHKIYSSDPGGKTLLNIASRNNNSNWTDLMTFTSDNKVGIGTTNPLAKLHIETNKWQNSLLTLKDTHYSPHQIYHFQIESDGLKIKQNNTINYQFKTGGDFIVNNGNLGIGTTNPLAKLHVVGNTLGSVANNKSTLATIQGLCGTSNHSKLEVLNRRSQSGTNWEKTSLRLQRVVDNTQMAFIDFGIENKSYNYGLAFGTGNIPQTRMVINDDGNVGIGLLNPTEKLTVNGKILCEEVEVIQNVLPDYVFQKYYTGASTLKEDYIMPTLEEVAAFTKKNHHLPEVPSAATVKEEGMKLKEMTTLLLQKIEELTLYTIEQEKRINALESKLVGKKS